MFFILNSGHSSTLMQLATGTGKSLMFGLMAHFINTELKYKVAVVVPNETLATIQQDKYCPQACKVSDDLFDASIKEVFYCTYDDFLSGKIPLDTCIFVDEIDTMFFADKPEVKSGLFISAILLLNKY